MEVSGQLHAPAALTPGKISSVPQWGPELVWTLEKNLLSLSGIELWPFQPIDRLYIVYATPAPVYWYIYILYPFLLYGTLAVSRFSFSLWILHNR
jgi:hypothetical protein